MCVSLTRSIVSQIGREDVYLIQNGRTESSPGPKFVITHDTTAGMPTVKDLQKDIEKIIRRAQRLDKALSRGEKIGYL